jgi:hypothetical protein
MTWKSIRTLADRRLNPIRIEIKDVVVVIVVVIEVEALRAWFDGDG